MKNVEWLVVGTTLLAAIGIFLLGFRLRGPNPGWIIATVFALSLGGWSWNSRLSARSSSLAELLRLTPRNGGPEGYVSSDTCRTCHPAHYESWHRSYHRTMTQLATPETLLADFSQQRLQLAGTTYELEQRGGRRD